MRVPLLLLLLLHLLTISTPREIKTGGKSFADPNSFCGERSLGESVSSSSAVVVGEIIEVKPPLGVWSGEFAVVQRVHYKVKDVLKGRVSEELLDVGHYVIANSSVADSRAARLSPEIFAKGRALILFLKPDPKKGYLYYPEADRESDRETNIKTFLSLDACGALQANQDSIEMVRKAMPR